MSYHILVIAGPDAGRAFPLEDGQTLVIGRGQSSHTQINDARLSRVHCEVHLDRDTATLTHAGGSGGTLVRSQPIERHVLKPGDVFAAGESQFRFQLGAGADQTTVGGAAEGMFGRPKPPPKAAPMESLVGQTFSSYRLDAVIAKGSSGLVFRGTDQQKNQTVAVKVLSPEYSGDEQQKERFVRAMQTMLPIHDEHIIGLYAAGKNGPYCWAAMEYVDGESLARVIERIGVAGMLDWRDAFRVAVQIGRALDTAYQHKIIHRNVTPENILQRKSDKRVKLGDLMLAKALEGTQARQVTTPGQLVGDVAYMSPERTRDQAAVDHRSDIYGLGATVYALLTGRPPLKANSLAELVRKIRDEQPAPPKKHQLSIPDLFQDIVLKMLAKSPDDRFQKPAEFLKELNAVAKYQGIAD
jgi:serine/threonine protein kinase